ncbi:MAG: hypothetical protein H7Y03_02970 [Chitinophagaceae bacterium]|nr:hypothetical protein [Chitinophagaceae bacterium]
MSQINFKLLTGHLDGELQPAEREAVERQIRENDEWNEEWSNIQRSVEAIRHSGLYGHVGAIRKQYDALQAVDNVASRTPVRSIVRNLYRIAAFVLLIAGSASVYQYMATNPASIYNQQYAAYSLGSNRGSADASAIEEAYRNGDWKKAAEAYGRWGKYDTKHCFLAGMAQMELKQYKDAAIKFTQVLAYNREHSDNYFRDEAEFYLAMSYLATGEVSLAVPLLKKIRAESNHLFQQRVARLSVVEMNILEFKER